VLSRPAFRCQQCGAVNIFEISKGEFVSGFRIFSVTIVNSEMPFCVFREAVLTNELVLLLRGGLVVAPSISLVCDEPALSNQLLRKRKRAFIELDVFIVGNRKYAIIPFQATDRAACTHA